jgi:uncharacterized membrane protein
MKLSGRLAGAFYIALIVLQPVWHGLLPPPAGAGNWLLAALATAPLLLPMKGVLAGSLRSMTWAGYLVMLYLAIGIMEAWSNPPQRVPALVQTGLVIAFVAAVLVFSGSLRRKS